MDQGLLGLTLHLRGGESVGRCHDLAAVRRGTRVRRPEQRSWGAANEAAGADPAAAARPSRTPRLTRRALLRPPDGRSTRRLRRGLDVLVEPEHVGRVVAPLDLRAAGRSSGRTLRRVSVAVLAVTGEVEVDPSPCGPRLEPLPEVARPGDVRLVLVGACPRSSRSRPSTASSGRRTPSPRRRRRPWRRRSSRSTTACSATAARGCPRRCGRCRRRPSPAQVTGSSSSSGACPNGMTVSNSCWTSLYGIRPVKSTSGSPSSSSGWRIASPSSASPAYSAATVYTRRPQAASG